MQAIRIITRALRVIGAAAVGETIPADAAQDGLTVLNGMIGQWALQRLTMVVEAREIFDLVTNVQTYTIGLGGDFDVARPVYLPRASILSYNNPIQPLELPIQVLSTQRWQATVPTKAVYSALPTACYYDFAYPLGNISYWPIPNIADLQTALYLPTALSTFATLTTDYDFAPGYEEAIVYQLALRLAPEYGRPAQPEVIGIATKALGVVKRANIRIEELRVDGGLIHKGDNGYYDFISDQLI